MKDNADYEQLVQKIKNLEDENIKIKRQLFESQEYLARYRGIVDNTINGVTVYKPVDNGENFIVVAFNKSAEHIEKIKKENVIGKKITDIFPNIKSFELFDILKKVFKTGCSEKHPISFYENNKICWWRDNFVYKLSSGEIVVVYIDETEKKRSEEALIESEKRYRAFYELSADGILIADFETKNFKYANPSICKMLEYNEQELTKLKVDDIHPKESLNFIISEFDAQVKGEKTIAKDIPVIKKDGSIRYFDIATVGSIIDDRRCAIGFFRDVTEKRQAEQELKESKERYELAMKASNDGLFEFDIITNEVTYSPRWYTMLEYEPFELPEKYETWKKLLPEDEADSIEKQVLGFVKTGKQWKFKFRMRAKSGRWVWILAKGQCIEWLKNKPKRIIGTHTDITDMKTIEEALIKSEFELNLKNKIADIFLISHDDDIFKKILEFVIAIMNSSCGMFGHIGSNEEMFYVSSKCESQDKYQTVKSESYIIPRQKWEGLWGISLIEKKTLYSNTNHHQLPNKHIIAERLISAPIIYRDELIGHIIVGNKSHDYDENDKTLTETISSHIAPILFIKLQSNNQKKEKERLEKQLLHVQKMEAIGTLAGGIAHDFNNILSPIIGYAEMTKTYLTEGSKLYHNLEKILQASNRAKELVKQILIFSRWAEHEKKPIRLTPIIKESLQLLRPSIPTTIEIKTNLTNCGLVLADPTQIHQIIINLCTNAYHATEQKGGLISISLDEIQINEGNNNTYKQIKHGMYAKLSVRDTGKGMTKEVMEKIFDPYFTTKESGKGTGLGLSIIHGIVKDHGGFLNVHSEIEKGSMFNIFLPIAMEAVSSKTEISSNIVKGKGSILFVDDEYLIVEMAKNTLEFLGYEVTATTSPLEAFDLFLLTPSKFELVMTDMTMPSMTGLELSKKIMQIKPDIPIILTTGFTELITEKEAKDIGIKEFITKPFFQAELSKIIQKVLMNIKSKS
ncbi:MAG: PAS domain S-box protein [Desulfobacterales bacterium]|nr:PAS domain S-box protein [Desulfobacterales bacterium]